MRRTTDRPAVADPARMLRDALRRLLVAHGALDEARRPCGSPLSLPHAWALLELRGEGCMTITALSRRLHIDRTNVSRLCARMESLGEIERRPHPHDGRAHLVGLTAEGEKLAAGVDAASATHFARVLARLEPEPVGVARTLESLAAALSAAAAPPKENRR